MGSRGRKSAKSLDIPTIGGAVLPFRGGPRQPPVLLTPAQREIWRTVIESPTGELITPECEPLLLAYCRATERAEQLAKIQNSITEDQLATEGGWARYQRVGLEMERINRDMVKLTTALRIAPHSRVHKESAGKVASIPRGPRPWQG